MNIEESGLQFLDSIPKIRVVVRKRPLTKREIAKSEQDIIEVRGIQSVIVREAKQKVDLTKYLEEHLFNFDLAFDESTTNHSLYAEAVRPLVDALFLKAKCTCFAYGQTGSGKTFTMMGNPGDNKENQNPIPGLYLLAAQDVFALLDQQQFKHLGVFISFYEIYCGKLHDLLNERQEVFAREDSKKNVNIVGLSEKKVMNVHALMQIIDFGNSVRTTGSTSANLDSSRSHAILQILLKENNKPYGKLSFIDLAGSERGADVAETNKQTRMDGAEINKSLLALKECIRALDQDKKHTPFRGSKLTLVLKDSFTGNCKTVMIGNISPSGGSCEHTLNTLRYADRVKELKKPQDGASNSGPISQIDALAKQLMLPRMQKNTTRIMIKEDDDDNTESSNIPVPQLKSFQSDRMSTNPNNISKGRVTTPSLGSVSTTTSSNSSYTNLSSTNQSQRQQQQQSQGLLNNNGLNINHNSLTTQVYNLYNNNAGWNPNKADSNNLFNNTNGNGNVNFQQGFNSQNLLSQNSYMNAGNQNQNIEHRPPLQSQQQKFQLFPQQQQPQQYQQPQYQQRQQYQNYQPSQQQQQQQQQQLFFNPNNSNQMNIENRAFDTSKPMKDLGNIYNVAPLFNQNNLNSKPFAATTTQNNGNVIMAANNSNYLLSTEPQIQKSMINANENGIGFSPVDNLTIKNEEDLQALNQRHEEIINTILAEEEEIISTHRQHIDNTVEITRQEMTILNEVEKPASDIDNYVTNLENILNYKIDAINALKAKVLRLKECLREEEQLSKKFYEQRNEAMDIFDLNEGENHQNNDDGLLVDDI